MTPQLGMFTSFDLSPEEEAVGATFNLFQKAWMQNRRYELQIQLNNLVPDFQQPTEYFYARAQLLARIDQLTELIDSNPITEATTTEGN